MKKIFSIAGMVVSCVIILLGIMVMAGELTNGYDYYSTAGYSYDSGAASFGGDFYTFVNNNAYEAAAAAQATSRNVGNLIRNVDLIAGILLMGMGAFGLLGFGVVFAGTREPKFVYSAPAAPSYAPPAPPAPQEPAYREPEQPFDYRHQSSAQGNIFTDLPDQN